MNGIIKRHKILFWTLVTIFVAALLLLFLFLFTSTQVSRRGFVLSKSVKPFLTSNQGDQGKSFKPSSQNGSFQDELNTIENTTALSLSSDSLDMVYMEPKNQAETLSEINGWLKTASLYEGKIPTTSSTSSAVVFGAYVGPAILYMSTSNNHKITIEPAYYFIFNNNGYRIEYISDVLEFTYDGKKKYILSNHLYDWFKKDQWKTEFDPERSNQIQVK